MLQNILNQLLYIKAYLIIEKLILLIYIIVIFSEKEGQVLKYV